MGNVVRLISCGRCKYGITLQHGMLCVRYPSTVLKRDEDWCGEWAPQVAQSSTVAIRHEDRPSEVA